MINLRGKEYLLSRIADYSVGYQVNDVIFNHLIVVEAKRRCIADAYGQLLSYMGLLCLSVLNIIRLLTMLGMVYSASKQDSKKNTLVYGVATDWFEYKFWRIDNDGNVSRNPSSLFENVVN
jgi:hypothetical protein